MRRLAPLAALILSNCTQIQSFTADDLAAAEALATATGDTPGAQCWQAQGPVLAAITGGKVGLATLIEAKRVESGLAAGPCASITAGAFMDLLALGGKITLPGI